MKEYIIDGTILFIREPTGRKLQGYRIPSFRDQTLEDGTLVFGSRADISREVPDPILVEVDEIIMRPATENEYKEWQNLDYRIRHLSTKVWPVNWSSDGPSIIGVTCEWVFDYKAHPIERMPEVKKSDIYLGR